MSEAVVTLGKVQTVSMADIAAQGAQQTTNDGAGGSVEKTQAEIDAEAAAAAAATANSGDSMPELSEEQRQAFLKSIGFEGSVDDLKTKLQPASAQPTPEQIELKQREHDKRLLDLHVSQGGTAESFVAMKQLMSADVSEVSKSTLHKQLIDSGIDEDEAKAIAKQMFLEHDLQNIEQGEFEEDADFEARKQKLEKQINTGAKVLANLGLPIINKAKSVYESLESEIQAKDKEAAEEVELSSKIDTHLKALPRELKIEFGEVNGKAVDPITAKIPEEAFVKVATILKDVEQRTGLFYDEQGQFNFSKVAEILLRNEALESAAKDSLLEGQTRQVNLFKAQFPDRTAQTLGVGGAAQRPSSKDAVVSTGKVQKAQPQR